MNLKLDLPFVSMLNSPSLWFQVRGINSEELLMQKTNNKFIIPGILGASALCALCVCCGGIFLYLYGDSWVSQTVSPSPKESNLQDNPNPQTSVDPSRVHVRIGLVLSA